MGDNMNKGTENYIFQYLRWRGDLSFEQDRFNEVDAFIFSQLTYYDYSGIVGKEKLKLKTALKVYYDRNHSRGFKLGLIFPDHMVELGKLIMKTKRYEDIYISDYVDKYDRLKKEQFTGVTFHLNDNLLVVSYKGTDDTLIGWEENFNMIISFPVAAQVSAKEYMDDIAESYPKAHYYLTGHSKGGNLAMYAGFYVNPLIQNKIVRIYNFDGPGFESDDIDQEKYLRIKNKIKTVVPVNSIIGMIFEPLGNLKAVKSPVKPVYQHDGFMWEIECNRFARTPISKSSSQFSIDLNKLVGQLNEEERRSFCNSLEKYIDELGIKTLTEALSLKTKSIKALKVFTKKDREIFFNFVKILIKNGVIR